MEGSMPDLFNCDEMLINDVDMNIKLTRAPDAFYLLAYSDDKKQVSRF
jgi:hypothetical protein